uniref:Endonuclease/exonuclease/phosphatase domain-containing protein n=1 Tax=Gouania willdenowi TaxID=441366 RepID=A0A8C5E2X0_GOUWI
MGLSSFLFFSTNKRGVVILLHKNLSFTITAYFKDTEGRFVLVKGVLHGETTELGNVYAPNIQDEAFYASLLSHLPDMDCPNIIIGDDFNCALSPMMDRLLPHANTSKNAKIKHDLSEVETPITTLDAYFIIFIILQLTKHWVLLFLWMPKRSLIELNGNTCLKK